MRAKSKQKLLFLFLFAFLPFITFSQCAGPINITVNPAPLNNGYSPGTVVTYCVTMTGYNQLGTNWFEGFDINLGPGWLPGSITPISPPANCGGAGSGGSWIWLNSSTASVAPFQTFGPGYFFDEDGDGLAGDDFGDAGNCTWTFCFSVIVGNNIGASLLLDVAPLSDGVAGSWISGTCDAVPYSNATPSNVLVNGCLLTATANITANVTCFGGNDGSVLINPANGLAPFLFSLNGGIPQANGIFSGLSAGNYSALVTAADGCTATANFLITQPATGILPIVLSQTNVSCNGLSDADFTISSSLGTAPYSYSVNGAAFSSNSNFQNLQAGNYFVSVLDASGCTASIQVSITEPAPIQVSVTSQIDVLCFGQNTGQVNFSGSGGTAPYSFSFNGAPYGPSSSFSNLSSGTYNVTIMDIAACTASAQINITQPAQPLSVSIASQIDVACFGAATGELALSAVGGTAPYTFSLNAGPQSANPVFNNLTSGLYAVMVQDANSCTASVNASISQPAAGLSSASVITAPADCFGAATGSVSITASGGTSPYQFSLNGSSNSTGNFSSLISGAYNAVISDANACTALVPFVITQPIAPLTLNLLSQTNVLCFGASSGQVTLTAAGGTSPYSYSLSGGGGGNNQTFSNLLAGNYSFIVTDANSCTSQLSINITQPAIPVSLNLVNLTDVLCYGANSGEISVSAQNGTPPYQYNIAANISATGTFPSLNAGNYAVEVSDANGCTALLAVAVGQPLQPLQLNLLTLLNPLCDNFSDGSISVSASGGTPGASGYQYQWSNSPASTSNALSGIPEGSYTLVVTDANACTSQQTYTLDDPDFEISFPTPPSLCAGDTLELLASYLEGAAPVNFSWDFSGAGIQSGSLIQHLAQNSSIINLNAIDANGCQAPTFTLPLTVNPSPQISFSVDQQSGCIPFCPTFQALSDIANSVFQWSFGNGASGSGQQISFCYSENDSYDVALQVTSPQGCSSILNQIDFISVATNPLAEFSIANQSINMSNPVPIISNQSARDCNLKWDFGDGVGFSNNEYEPIYTYKAPGNYCISLVTENILGCTDSASVCITVNPEMTNFAPNAFSPNGDGLNDFFNPVAFAYADIEMSIYSRWGERVFYIKGDKEVIWTGEGFPDGVYVYDIVFRDSEANTKRLKGTVTLIR